MDGSSNPTGYKLFVSHGPGKRILQGALVMRQTVYLVRQNLKRKRFRTLVMIGSIALACATLFMAVILSKGIRNTLEVSRQRLGADIVAVPVNSSSEAQSALISGNPTAFYMPASLEDKVKQVAGVQQTCPQVFLRSLDAPCCVAQVALVGYEPECDFTINPWGMQKSGTSLREDQIIVGAKVISAVVGSPMKAIGQRLIFMGKPFSVAMILEPTGLGTDYTVFVTMETAYRMTQDSPLYPVPVKRDQISTILIKVSKDEDPAVVAGNIEQALPELKALTAGQLTHSISEQLESLVNILFMSGGVFCALAIILAGSLFILSVRHRMRELGLFRAMGARSVAVSSLIVLEAVCIAGAGGLIGVLIGLGSVYFGKDVITDMIGNMYTWPDLGYFAAISALCMAGAVMAGVIGGMYPARRISRLDPYEAIRKGV